MNQQSCVANLAATILLACGTAAAQSNAQVYGLIDVYAGKKKLASPAGTSTINVNAGGMSTSYLGFRGSEDLGDGMSAIFDVSSNFVPDTGGAGRFDGDVYFSRSSWVGLAGDWGIVRLGRMTSPNFLVSIRVNPFANSTSFSPYLLHTYVGGQPLDAAVAPGGPAAASDSGYSNAVTYSSPTRNGFQGTLSYSFGESTGSNSANRRVGYSLTYDQGPWLLAFGAELVNQPTIPAPPTVPAANQKTRQNTNQWGGAYNFGPAKVFASYSRTDINLLAPNTRKFDTTQIGVSVPAGVGLIMLSGAQTTKRETSLADIKRTTWSLGYDYYLSKRTDLYIAMVNDRVTAMQTGTSLALGIRHQF